MQLTEKHRQYWSKNLRITSILLAIWFFVTFVLGFYCLIIWYYARYMNRLDQEHGVAEEE
ncbi:MAG: DUF4212 domain-containing protein [Aquabacterium sp.]|nr:DUF4212 domain-containing protein [Aquabacterium sp.]